jgi:hypothetical protein
MTPADPIWLLAEILASVARMVREQRRRRAERRRMAALLPGGSVQLRRRLLAGLAGRPRREPEQLPDVLYSRVQAALMEFSRRRDMRLTDHRVARQAVAGERALSWNVRGREVTVRESRRPLFRAVWSSHEGGWRLYWSRDAARWWPYANGSHLSIGSFETCVREVERDPRSCFPPAEAPLKTSA